MRSVVYPPVDPRPAEFVITRRPFGRKFLLSFPWGESYWLRSPNAAMYLRMLGDPAPAKALDLAWNFRAIHYTVDTHEALIVPPGTVSEVLRDEPRQLVAMRG